MRGIGHAKNSGAVCYWNMFLPNRDSLSPEVCGMYPPLSGIEPTTATTCTNCSMMLVQLIVIYHKQQK